MAGCSSSAKGSLPKRADSSAQAEGQPGTVTGNQPCTGIWVCPAAFTASMLSEAGARPLASRPWSWSLTQTRAKASPPMAQPVGSTTVSAAAVAMAASMALPPARSRLMPASAARGCEVATMPLRANTLWRWEA